MRGRDRDPVARAWRVFCLGMLFGFAAGMFVGVMYATGVVYGP